MKIVEIKLRRKSLCGILFDEEVNPALWGADSDAAGWLCLDAELCEIKHLKVGTELADTELVSLIEQSHIKRAKSRAMWYISRSDCSKAGLKKKLLSAFPDYAAEAAVLRLEELGLLDDTAYAERKLQRILAQKKVSLKMAKQLLISEGLDREIAENAVNSIEYGEDDALCELIERKYQGRLNSKKDVDKMISALLRKGYSFGKIKDTLNSLEIELSFTEELP